MKFVDEATLRVQAGNGGRGCLSFRREKFMPFGGPDGGDGGHGGSVWLRAAEGINTLADFRIERLHKAKSGEGGSGNDCFGKGGPDYYVTVPVGTTVRDVETGEELGDLKAAGQEIKVAQGGKGGWGNAFVGTWDTPHKLIFNQVRGWFSGTNVYGGGATLLFGGSNSNVGNGAYLSAGGASVMGYRRQARSVSYHSPSFSGFSFQGMFSAGNERSAAPPAGTVAPLEPRMWSGNVAYNNGPIFAALAYERHKDFNPGGQGTAGATPSYRGGTDTGWMLAGGYTFGGVFKLTGAYAKNSWDTNSAPIAKEVKSKGYAVYGDWQIQGPHSLKAEYGKAKSPTGTIGASAGIFSPTAAGNSGGKVYGIDYAYAFSKRTEGYLGYANLKNGAGTGAFNQGIAAASVGTSQKFYGMGLKHKF